MIISRKPITSGQRSVQYEDRSVITSQKPYKKLLQVLNKKSGRDNLGHISTRHKGGGAKKMYRSINFGNEPLESATVETIEYDPNRNAYIALINEGGNKKYIIATTKIKVGQLISFNKETLAKDGNRMLLKNIPTGLMIYNIEIQPDSKAKIARAAGSAATILSKDDEYVTIKLPSGEIRKFNPNCYASLGQVSNAEHKLIKIGKAGRKRHMGVRPTVRGKAMHPAAHPHGGGEGVNSIGLKYPKTPWGKHARGVRTRKGNKPSAKFISNRRKK